MDLLEQLAQTLRAALPAATTRDDRFKIRAALCALGGDASGAEQNLAVLGIPQAEWDAAQQGEPVVNRGPGKELWNEVLARHGIDPAQVAEYNIPDEPAGTK